MDRIRLHWNRRLRKLVIIVGVSIIFLLPLLSNGNFQNFLYGIYQPNTEEATNNLNQKEQHLPSVLIVGVDKCGTRALLNFLKLHPLLKFPEEQIHFFDDSESFKQGLDWYKHKMPMTTLGKELTVDWAPYYFFDERVPFRLGTTLGLSIKIILVLCEPSMRAVTAHRQDTNITKASFDECLDDWATYKDMNMLKMNCKAIYQSIYSKQIEHWKKAVDTKNLDLHIVDGELFAKDPIFEIKRIEKFLNVPHRIDNKLIEYDSEIGFYCTKQSIGKSKCVLKEGEIANMKTDPRTAQKLWLFYRPYNSELFKIIGQKFDWPGQQFILREESALQKYKSDTDK